MKRVISILLITLMFLMISSCGASRKRQTYMMPRPEEIHKNKGFYKPSKQLKKNRRH